MHLVAFPLQITVDHGSETGDMYALQMALRYVAILCSLPCSILWLKFFRQNLGPQLDENAWPPFVAITSTHNIPIENLWSRLIKEDGTNIRLVLEQGRTNGLFNPMNDLHVYVSYLKTHSSDDMIVITVNFSFGYGLKLYKFD